MSHKASKAADAESDSPPDEEHGADEHRKRPAPRPLSVPAKASCLTFVFLLCAAITTAVVLQFTEDKMPWDWMWFFGVSALVIAIPIVVYRAVTLWMFDESARYPDIAHAWKAGIAELAGHGMAIDSAPLFIIVGTGSERLHRTFMSASGANFLVDGVCEPGSPLYWYADSDGIFLYLDDVCLANAAISLYETSAEARKRGLALPTDQPHAPARRAAPVIGTLVPGFRGGAQAPRRPPMPTDHEPEHAPAEHGHEEAAPAHSAPPGGQYMGTLTPGQVAPAAAKEARPAAPRPSATGTTSARVANRMSSQQSSQQLQRLEYLCGILRRHRHPVCPVNGVMTLLPFEILKAGDQEVAEVERALAADISTIYNELQLRCPVMSVVVGMDQEKGFRELIRRIGRDYLDRRFGQSFDLRRPATADELRKFTSHVCGTFEDWVYTLFREEGALSHPGNTALFALLCKMRKTLKSRLGDVLGKGFGSESRTNKPPVLFSGCYFAATGPQEDRQAFVHDLLEKLKDDQEEIEWTKAALREDSRRGWLIRVGWATAAVIALGIVAKIVVGQFGKQ